MTPPATRCLRLGCLLFAWMLSVASSAAGQDGRAAHGGGGVVQVQRAVASTARLTLAITREGGPDIEHLLESGEPEQHTLPTDWVSITCHGAGWICFPRLRNTTADASTIVVVAYPSARLTAKWPIALSGARVAVMVSRQLERGESALTDRRGTFEATVQRDGTMAVDVPRGQLDVRLAAATCAPVYRFGLSLTADRTLGSVECPSGGSVVARVRAAASGLPLSSCRVVLTPASREAGMVERLARLTDEVRGCDPRGFLQFSGVPPGRYWLTAEAPDAAPRDLEIDVVADSETSADVWLTPYQPLTVRVEPPVSPGQGPWAVSVRSTRAARQLNDTAGFVTRQTDSDGEVTFPRRGPDAHEVRVSTPDGVSFYSAVHERPPEGGPLTITLPTTHLTGRITRAGVPVSGARITLIEEDAPFTFLSDAEGHFDGWLAVAADAAPEFMAEVTLAGSNTERTFVVRAERRGPQAIELHLEMPTSRIAVRVLNRTASPEPSIYVAASHLDQASDRAIVTADERGEAIVDNLSPGRYRLVASSGLDFESDPVVVSVVDGQTATVDLDLMQRRRLMLDLVSQTGRPVPGAEVRVYLAGGGQDRSSTDEQGRLQRPLRLGTADKAAIFQVRDVGTMFLSACQALPDTDRLTMALPAVATGVLTLRLPPDMRSGGRLWILNDRGGAYSVADLERWALLLNPLETYAADGALVVPGLPAGDYRAVWLSTDSWLTVVAAACQGLVFPDAPRGYLGPGQPLTLVVPPPG